MRKIEIDIIGLQSAQRFLRRPRDVGRGQALSIGRHLHADLGGDHHVLALRAALQPVPEDGFRFTAAMSGRPYRIHIGGIHEVQSGVHRRIQHRKRRRLGRRPSEDVTAEAQGSNP